MQLAARHRLLGVAALLAAASVSLPAAATPHATSYSSASVQLGPLRQNPRVAILPGVLLGRDNAASVGAEGKSYWFFGDTFISPLGAVNNSAAVTSDVDGTDGISVLSSNLKTDDPVNAPVEAISKTPTEIAFERAHAGTADQCAAKPSDAYCGTQFAHWPGAAVYDKARHRLLVMTTKICRFGARSCTTGFTGTLLGGGITSVDLGTGTVRRLTIKHAERYWGAEGRDSTLLFQPDAFFGGTAWAEGGYLYTAYRCEPYGFTCSLARAPLGSVDDRRAWRFYTGQRRGAPVWSSSDQHLPRVLSTGAAGGTIQWAPAMKRYLAIYTVPYTSDVVYQTAAHPWGPWGSAQRLFATLAPRGDVPNYAAFAHPEYSPDGGLTQYVTYYHSGYGELELVRVKFCPTGTQLCA